MTETLRGLRPKALGALTRELDGETPLPAAVHVLRAVGLYGAVPAPQGRIEREDAVAAARLSPVVSQQAGVGGVRPGEGVPHRPS